MMIWHIKHVKFGPILGLATRPLSRNDEDIVVNEFALHQNYPNPFNPETTIKFSIPNKQDVDLSVYNMLGQRVVTLFNGELQGGNHIAKWHAGNIASGVYIYKLSSSNKTITQKCYY